MDGILLFNKPILWTSHDAVDFFRRRLGQKKVGHAGTLDPMATGLLVMLLGAATKASSRLSGLDKDYAGTMTLGITTDTQDLEGKIIAVEENYDAIDEGRVREVFGLFHGLIEQVPPAYSSVRKNGKKLYEWARKGVACAAEARQVMIRRFDLSAYLPPEAHFTLSCSKGTYVRALCDEAGKLLGCGAALSSLVRTRVGKFQLKDALAENQVSSFLKAELEKRIVSE